MTDDPSSDAETLAYVEAALSVLGLRVPSEWHPGILGHFEGLAAMGRLVLSFALADELEPAPVFRA